MTTDQKIREAFITYDKASGPIEFMCFRAGYLALLNSLEEYDDFSVTCYRLPGGVEK